MSHKWLIIINCSGVLILGIGALIWALTPLQASAECGSNPPPDSSCYTCHVEEDPVAGNGLWHGIHARKDCCARCHGGNCMAMDKDLAHVSMIPNPLNDIYTNCHSCHPDDYQTRAETFATELDITPASCATPTPVPTGEAVSLPLVILPPPVSNTPSGSPLSVVLGGSALIIMFILGIIVFITNLRS